jgi:hypothetical protein
MAKLAPSKLKYVSLMMYVIVCLIVILKLSSSLPETTMYLNPVHFTNPNETTTTTATTSFRNIQDVLEEKSLDSKQTAVHLDEKLPSTSEISLATFPPRNETPHPGWIYEPRYVKFFWKKMPDRPFISSLYPKLKVFSSVLDIGARGYNRNCKAMINSTATKYFQVEPFPPEELDNDGLLHCKVHEIPELYPQFQLYFDAVLDIGVLGAGLLTSANVTEANENYADYMKGLLFVIKPKGLWILKTNAGWVPDHYGFIKNVIEPHFDLGELEGWRSGIKPTRKKVIQFYFFYRKDSIPV